MQLNLYQVDAFTDRRPAPKRRRGVLRIRESPSSRLRNSRWPIAPWQAQISPDTYPDVGCAE